MLVTKWEERLTAHAVMFVSNVETSVVIRKAVKRITSLKPLMISTV